MSANDALLAAISTALDCLGGEYIADALRILGLEPDNYIEQKTARDAAGAVEWSPEMCVRFASFLRDHADRLARISDNLRVGSDILWTNALGQLVQKDKGDDVLILRGAQVNSKLH